MKLKLFENKKGAMNRVIGGGIAAVTMLVAAVIVGQVENGTSWAQTLSGTIGTYIEPLAVLTAFAIVGATVYYAARR